jgi:hypothetical protein
VLKLILKDEMLLMDLLLALASNYLLFQLQNGVMDVNSIISFRAHALK